MADIVEMLRDKAQRLSKIGPSAAKLSNAAADEIERLRTALTIVVRNTLPLTIAHTAAAAALCRPSVPADKEQR